MVNLKATGDDITKVILTHSTSLRSVLDGFSKIYTFLVNKELFSSTIKQVGTSSVIDIREACWENFIKDNFTHGCNQHRILLLLCKARFIQSFNRNSYTSMKTRCSALVSRDSLIRVAKDHVTSFFFLVVHSQIE
ncbi:hypothetical protein D1872_218820 [compost metagenome]